MMAVHALWVAAPDGGPTWSYALAAGRSAATFAVLAGVGIAFMTRRARVPAGPEGRGAAATLAARAGAIGGIGLALGYTDAAITAVILPYYAVLFLLAIPLVFLTNRALIVTGAATAVAVPVLSHLLRDALPAPELGNPSFGYLFSDPLGLISELSLTGYYPALPWITYLCAGLVVGRLSLSSARTAATLFGSGLTLAVTASLTSWLLLGPLGGQQHLEAHPGGVGSVADALAFGPSGTTPTSTWWWLATDAPHASTPPDLLHTTGVAVALLGALLLMTHLPNPDGRRVVTLVLTPLAAAGSMILTLYASHVAFLNSPLNVFGTAEGYLVQVSVALLFALAWRAAVGRGPLETAVTRLAHRARDAARATSARR